MLTVTAIEKYISCVNHKVIEKKYIYLYQLSVTFQPKHSIMVSAATSIQTLYKQQVTEEFKREFNIVWKGDRRCTISHKNNPDDAPYVCAQDVFNNMYILLYY